MSKKGYMKKMLLFLVTLVFLIVTGERYSSAGVIGIPDHVPAATQVPFFEIGIDTAVNSHDTLPVVKNTGSYTVTVHCQVWD